MKINEPVTQKEVEFPQDVVLVSKTDAKGIITYCNRALVDISGFSKAELIGENHNIVRHPDMPPVVYNELWDAVSAGNPWTGVVKNRVKNGDHYWVRANISPIFQSGRVCGYISVRTKPTREEISSAETRYRNMRAGQSGESSGLKDKCAAFMNNFSIKSLLASTVVASVLGLGVVAVLISKGIENDVIYGVLVALAAANALIGFSLTNYVTKPISYASEKLNQISQGVYFDWVDINRNDDFGGILKAIKMVQIKLGFDVMDAQESARSATRIQTAIDVVTTNVMLADVDYNIIYMNDSVQNLMSNVEGDIKDISPDFDAASLMGTSIDVFFEDAKGQRKVLDKVTDSLEQDLKIGFTALNFIATAVYDENKTRIGTAFEWRDRTEELALQAGEEVQLERERTLARENSRIRTALDNASSSVMLADNDQNIIYMNKAVHQLFNNAQQDFKRDIPGFDASNLMGANISSLSASAGNQMDVLKGLNSVQKSEFIIGGRTMQFVATPVENNGEVLGVAIEWDDRTLEVAIEEEVEGIVEAAKSGVLEERIELSGKTGFFKDLSVGINSLLDAVTGVFNDVANVLNQMEAGNLTEVIVTPYEGRFGEVRVSVNGTVKNLEGTVRQLRKMAEHISSASDEISSGNANLSSRTEQQATGLEETASSMLELTSAVRQNADNAQQANQVATTARQSAEKGGEVVNNAIDAMDAINKSSNKIAEIIGVIDEIAFQTNLLALNASVEAARAGEQGRGFAVVATEVRNLASRSADAAKEIKTLIQDSQVKVKTGADLVSESGETLDEIVQGVKKVGDIVAEIAASSAEQATGIDQINKSVASIDEITQQNAALAEETASASVSMFDKAAEMNKLITFFDVRQSSEDPWDDEV